MRRFLRFFFSALVILLLAGLAGGIYYWAFILKPKFLAEVIGNAPKPAKTVSAEAARTEDWSPEISAIGTLVAVEGIDIATEVGGLVKSVEFHSGQSVAENQLLVSLDAASEEAELKSLQAELDMAGRDLNRQQKIFDKGFASRATLDGALLKHDGLVSKADRLKAIVAKKSIRAPWAGTLGLRNLSPGQYVAPGQAIVRLQKTNPVFVDFPATEAQAAHIGKGQDLTARFEGWPGAPFRGKVLLADTMLAQTSQTLTVRGELANPDARLLPGMYANVTVVTGPPEPAVTVPLTAINFSLYGNNVLVAVEQKPDAAPAPATPPAPAGQTGAPPEFLIERRFVTVGDTRDNRIAIVKGVAAGDQIVVAGQNKIEPGSRVVINNSIALTPGPDAEKR